MEALGKIVVYFFAVLLAAALLPGIQITGYLGAFLVGVLLIVLNMTVKPLITLFTLPITFLTLGLFSFVINGLIVVIADWLLLDLTVDNFLWAILFSLVVSIVVSVFEGMTGVDGKPGKR